VEGVREMVIVVIAGVVVLAIVRESAALARAQESVQVVVAVVG
jgi:hypothetical protein